MAMSAWCVPRLADAAFFWDTDRKERLETRFAALKSVTFQDKLGSLADKSTRVVTLAQRIAESDFAVTPNSQPAPRSSSKCDC